METKEYQFQINSAILTCQGRIENGASITDAFNWLTEEVNQICNGICVYTYDDF